MHISGHGCRRIDTEFDTHCISAYIYILEDTTEAISISRAGGRATTSVSKWDCL